MGMFASLFGNPGSDKSDQLRQQAQDAFNAVKTPALSSLQVTLQNAVQAGKITPEQAETTLLNSNAFNQIKEDPSLVGAQKQALQALQDTASAGGLTAVDKAQLQDITTQQNQQNSSANAAIMADARARGTGNSNLTAVQKLISQQGSANTAANSGLTVAAQAQARALQAMQAAGTQAQSTQAQEDQEAQAKAGSQNAIDQFNATNQNATNKTNVANDLAAQETNQANTQHVNDENTATQNAATVNNANANQTIYNDALQKATGVAGVDQNWANTAQQTQDKETAGDVGITSGLISAGAKAAVPLAGALSADDSDTGTSSLTNGTSTNSNYNDENSLPQGYAKGGMVKPAAPLGTKPHSIEDEYHKFTQQFCNGGTVNMADGGKIHIKAPTKVPGVAPVSGDSPTNDIVDAKLSPGEIVVPRSDVAKVEQNTGTPMMEALKRLANPQNPQVGSARG